MRSNLLISFTLLLVLTGPAPLLAAERADQAESDGPELNAPPPGATASDRPLCDDLQLSLRNLSFVQVQDPVRSPLNPGNHLKLSRTLLENDLRPDLKLLRDRLELRFKPRLELRWEEWEEGFRESRSGEDADLFVQEWLARVEPVDGLFLSYGREDLQWGPAYLLSPSNPFYTENGRSQPKREVAAADYARLVWAPRVAWTGSLIVNTDEGRKDPRGDFNPTYAVKIDHLVEQGHFSLILGKQESADLRTGLFASWNLSEALILYGEGSLSAGQAEALAGGSYTFANGGILTLEYFYNGRGSGSGALRALELTREVRDTLVRRNYALLQYYYQPALGEWNALLRLVRGIDDQSAMLLGHGEYNLGEHLQLFATASVFSGDRDSEFGSLLDYRALVGVELFF